MTDGPRQVRPSRQPDRRGDDRRFEEIERDLKRLAGVPDDLADIKSDLAKFNRWLVEDPFMSPLGRELEKGRLANANGIENLWIAVRDQQAWRNKTEGSLNVFRYAQVIFGLIGGAALILQLLDRVPKP